MDARKSISNKAQNPFLEFGTLTKRVCRTRNQTCNQVGQTTMKNKNATIHDDVSWVILPQTNQCAEASRGPAPQCNGEGELPAGTFRGDEELPAGTFRA